MTAPRHTWEGIRAEILRRITARTWAPGDLMPGEAALAAEFGCSRATVNRALRSLSDTGMIERRRKAGTRVALNPVRKATISIPVIRLDVERKGQVYRHVLLEQRSRKPPAPVVNRLDLKRNAAMIHLRSLHMADNRPLAYEDRWLNPAVVADAATADFAAVSPNEWLVRNAPFTRVEIAFSAAAADEREAAHLDVAAGAPLFVVDRTTWNGGAAITAVRLCYAPGYRMLTTL